MPIAKLGGADVDDQLHLCDLLYRQVARLCALEDAARIHTDLAPRIGKVGSLMDVGELALGQRNFQIAITAFAQ